ncbi:hypothetical protein SDC9_113887 [bioreactor metagenome]|uniref:Uncharacterized protein n=1 Tax=bioreactor metagenome TaxID=1076179 RepID=A0A645BUR2_9ZZZZ
MDFGRDDDGDRAAADPGGEAVDGGTAREFEHRAHDRARVGTDIFHEAVVRQQRHDAGKDDEDYE